MKKTWLAAASAALLMPLASLSHGLNLQEAYQLALKNDAQWAAAEATYQSDLETENQGLAGLLPRMAFKASRSFNQYESGSSGTTEVDCEALADPGDLFNQPIVDFCNDFNEAANLSSKDSYQSQTYSVTLNQPLFRMDQWHTYQGSKARTKQGQEQYREAQQDLIVRVSQAYFDLLRAQQDLTFTEREDNDILEQLKMAQQRVDLGLSEETDVFDAQAAYDTSQASLVAAQALLNTQRRALEAIIGESVADLANLKEAMPVQLPSPADPNQWVKQANARSPQIAGAQFARQAAKEEYRKQRAGHYPTINLSAGYNESKLSGGSGFTPGSTASSIAIDLSVPIYSGGAVSASRRQASYRHEEAQHRLGQTRRQIENGTRDLHGTVVADVRRTQLNKRSIDSNQKALEATRASYEAGVRFIVDVLNAQRGVFSAKRDYTNARYDYVLNTLKLKQIAGVLDESDIGAINAWLGE